MPMQYTEIFFFKLKKLKIFSIRFFKIRIQFDIFLIFAQNIDCGYTLEPPRRGGSNEYPQSSFWGKDKKKRYTPMNSNFALYQSGAQGGIHYTDMLS